MVKKEIEMCDWCEDEEAIIRIIKGDSRGNLLCENCFDEWKDAEIEDKYEDIDE
jgi:hypothetical protein